MNCGNNFSFVLLNSFFRKHLQGLIDLRRENLGIDIFNIWLRQPI